MVPSPIVFKEKSVLLYRELTKYLVEIHRYIAYAGKNSVQCGDSRSLYCTNSLLQIDWSTVLYIEEERRAQHKERSINTVVYLITVQYL